MDGEPFLISFQGRWGGGWWTDRTPIFFILFPEFGVDPILLSKIDICLWSRAKVIVFLGI